jgi:hypothetical protein
VNTICRATCGEHEKKFGNFARGLLSLEVLQRYPSSFLHRDMFDRNVEALNCVETVITERAYLRRRDHARPHVCILPVEQPSYADMCGSPEVGVLQSCSFRDV